MVLVEVAPMPKTGGAPFAMPDFYEFLQRPLGGDLLTVPRGLYHLPRRPLLLSDWPPFNPTAALPPAHFYYGYYATAAAGLVSTYLRESSTASSIASSVQVASSTSWAEHSAQATPLGASVALQRRLHARGRRPLQLQDAVSTSANNVGAAAAAAEVRAAAAPSNMKCLGDVKRTMKANERWAPLNKQTYQQIVDATLKEMTSSPCEEEQQHNEDDDEDDQPEESPHSPLAAKRPLQLARSITPIFRRSPGAGRAREALLRHRGLKGSSAPSQDLKERATSPVEGKGRSQESEPLDLSTHSARSAGDLLGLMVCPADEQLPPRQGLSVQTRLHNWQSVRPSVRQNVRQSVAPSDPAATAATPRAVWVRAQSPGSAHSATALTAQHCQLLSSETDVAGDGRTQRSDSSDSNSPDYSLTTDATPRQSSAVSSQEETQDMSSGVAMSSHGGLRSKEDLWVPLNKDTVLGLVNDVVDSMVSNDRPDRYSGVQRSASRTSDSERATPPTPRHIPRGIRRPPPLPAAKHTTVMDSSPTSLSCPPKSTSQKENMHSASRPRPTPASPAKGTAPARGDNVDRWVAITKMAMRDIVENAIRCELEGDETATTPSDDRSDAPESCGPKSKAEGQPSEVDYNANEQPSQESSSQGQGSSGRSSQKRARSPSPTSPLAPGCEGNKRTKGEEGATKSPLEDERRSPQPDKERAGEKCTHADALAKSQGAFKDPPLKVPTRPTRASPPCTGPRRIARTQENPPNVRPHSVPPPSSSDSANSARERKGPSTATGTPAPGRTFKAPPGPDAKNRQLTAWVAVSKNMVNSMIEDILVDNKSDTNKSDEDSAPPYTPEVTSDTASCDSFQGQADDLSKASDLQCRDESKSRNNNTPPPAPSLAPSSLEQDHRQSPSRSPTSSPETETTDSTCSSDQVTSSSAVCKSSFKLKSAMLERFNEERKSSASSPSLPSPVTSSSPSVTSSSPSVTPSPSLTARSTPSPTSPATSKVKQTLSVVCDAERPCKGPQNSPTVAHKGPSKSKKAPRSRQTAATKE